MTLQLSHPCLGVQVNAEVLREDTVQGLGLGRRGLYLDLAGVACSTGSACSSGSLLPSPVLQAMGVPEHVLHSAMRFSLSALLTEADVREAARRIAVVVNRLRKAIPAAHAALPAGAAGRRASAGP